MPGKYPTINSPITARTTLTAGGTVGLSNSDTMTLNAMFPTSPIYTTLASDYLTTARDLLQPAVQEGDAVQFPSVDMDYTGAPDVSSITDINGVAIDSPYYPNLIVNSDPTGGEGSSVVAAGGTAVAANDNFGTGGTVDTVTPSATAAQIATTTIDVSGPIGTLGQSEAWATNPGADGDPTT